MTIAENIEARKAHTTRLVGDQPLGMPVPAMTAAQAEKALFGWVYKPNSHADYQDCKDMLAMVEADRGADEANTILTRFGATMIGEVFPGLFVDFFNYARTVLYFGISPTAGWTCEADIPEDQRDRWLLAHPESGSVWEVRGTLDESEFDDPNVVEVSGQVEWEKRFADQVLKQKEESL